jgi:hypothetical protein
MAYVTLGVDTNQCQSSTIRKDYSSCKRGFQEEKDWPIFAQGRHTKYLPSTVASKL